MKGCEEIMINITGKLMSRDTVIATVKNGVITDCIPDLLPLYLRRTKDMESWLASRAIDNHRTNSRLLKKVLRIKEADDASAALAVNAATITDVYWFNHEGSNLTYEDIRFRENYFDGLALHGDPNCFSKNPSRTPELTNIGSFEKCWRLIDGEWWMYKSGNNDQYFSELFICKLGELLGLNVAHYEMDQGFIRSRNFVDSSRFNFEPMSSLTEDDSYSVCFDLISSMSKELAKEYLYLIWFDTICYNMDRHTGNFGFLRDVDTGDIVAMAPNFDNNIALISNGYLNNLSREHDGIIRFFREFVDSCSLAKELYYEMELPTITKDLIYSCLNEMTFDIDREYIADFIMNGYNITMDVLFGDITENENQSFGLSM